MAAHQTHFAYCGGRGRWMCYFPIPFIRSYLSSVCQTIIIKMKTETEQKTRFTIIYLTVIINIMRGENFMAYLDGLGGITVGNTVLKQS
jgi:hypothetical protein